MKYLELKTVRQGEESHYKEERDVVSLWHVPLENAVTMHMLLNFVPMLIK